MLDVVQANVSFLDRAALIARSYGKRRLVPLNSSIWWITAIHAWRIKI